MNREKFNQFIKKIKIMMKGLIRTIKLPSHEILRIYAKKSKIIFKFPTILYNNKYKLSSGFKNNQHTSAGIQFKYFELQDSGKL